MAKIKMIEDENKIIHSYIIFEEDLLFLGIKKGDNFKIAHYDNLRFKAVGVPYFIAPNDKKIIVISPPNNSEKIYKEFHQSNKLKEIYLNPFVSMPTGF